MHTLSPSLGLIEAHLFDPSDELIERWIANDPTLSPATYAALADDPVARDKRASWVVPLEPPAPFLTAETAAEPPAWLREQIERKVAARQAGFAPIPAAGQIVQVDEAIGPEGPLGYDQPCPLAVLLSEPTEHRQIWYGWLVAPETDYASAADLILEDDDGPRDPLAGMVQLWNPVYVYLPSAHGVLAQLTLERLGAVRALALDFLTQPPPTLRPQPGVLVERRTSLGHLVLTGTPLGGASDPRHRYRTLYRAAADLLREPVRLAQLQPTLPERLFDCLRVVVDRLRATGEALGVDLTPAPAPVMGEATAEIYHLGDWLELELRELEADIVNLRVRNLYSTPCRLQVIRHGAVRRERVLEGYQETELPLEAAPGIELALLDESGERLRWPLMG